MALEPGRHIQCWEPRLLDEQRLASVAPVSDSFGYRLPHRGNTTDQGNNEDYSRLDDGYPRTYWKSNPYLASAFTGDPDDRHPQWVVIDLGAPKQPVNAIKILWSQPYATRYEIQYWTGDDPIKDPGIGVWQPFPSGVVRDGRGGDAKLSLGKAAQAAQFVRLLMTRSSATCDSHGSADRRNCAGYAIDEISVGQVDQRGDFHDLVRHTPYGGESPRKGACGWRQTATYVSSVDPWHASANRVRNQGQPGLDLIARSGLTRGIGAVYPVPMLYSTPENAVAEIRYLKARGSASALASASARPDCDRRSQTSG